MAEGATSTPGGDQPILLRGDAASRVMRATRLVEDDEERPLRREQPPHWPLEQFVKVTGGPETADQQTISLTGSPTSGTFTLTFNGSAASAAIPYNATAAQVLTAFTGLSTVGANNATASGGPLPGTPVVITFAGTLVGATQPTITGSGAGLTPAGGAVSVAHNHGVNHFYHAIVQYRKTSDRTWVDYGAVWLDSGNRTKLDTNSRYYARLAGTDPTDNLPVWTVLSDGDDCCEADCCCTDPLAKPMGGAAMGWHGCCACGTKPPGGGGGVPPPVPGGNPCCTVLGWSALTGGFQSYICNGVATSQFAQYTGPQPGWQQVGNSGVWVSDLACWCAWRPQDCGGGVPPGGTVPPTPTAPQCCPPGYTGLNTCLINGVWQVVNCGAPGIRAGGMPNPLTMPMGGFADMGGAAPAPALVATTNTFQGTQTILQATAGSTILSQQTTTATNPVTYNTAQTTLNTTDGTITTLLTFPVTDEAIHAITVRVYGRRTGGSGGSAGDSAEFSGTFGVHRTGGGNAAFVAASVPTLGGTKDNGAVGATVDVNSTNLRVRVQGATNNNYRWDCHLQYGTITT